MPKRLKNSIESRQVRFSVEPLTDIQPAYTGWFFIMRNFPSELQAGLHLIAALDFRHSFVTHLNHHHPNRRAIHSKLAFKLGIDSAVASLFIYGSVDSQELFLWFDGLDSWLWEQRKIEPEYHSNGFSG